MRSTSLLYLRLAALGVAALLGLAAPAVHAQEEEQGSVLTIPDPDALAAQLDEGPSTPQPAPCGGETVTIARMQWPTSALLAHIHGMLLSRELGCEVQIVDGDLVGSLSSMATTGQPVIAPEVWVTRIAQIWNSAMQSQRLRPGGSTFSGGSLEGWYVPQHLAERFPELTTPDRLADVAQQLIDEGGRRLSFISCPPDWACSIINRNLIEAYGLTDLVDIVEPANRFELDTLIAQSVSRQNPVVFYYWQPNSVLAQFDFEPLAMGAYHAQAFTCLARRSCRNPEPSGFVAEPVFIVVPDWVPERMPEVSNYLLRAAMPLPELSELMAWQAENDATFEEAAAHFVDTRRDVWGAWVSGN